MTVDEIIQPTPVVHDHVDAGIAPAAPGRLRRWAMTAIIWYQRAVDGRPSPCRFTPSCSAYALESFETQTTGRATWLTLRRFTKCRPFGPSGYDPVPDPTPPSSAHAHSHEDC